MDPMQSQRDPATHNNCHPEKVAEHRHADQANRDKPRCHNSTGKAGAHAEPVHRNALMPVSI